MTIQQRAAKVLQEIDEQLALCEKATPGPWETLDGLPQCVCGVSFECNLQDTTESGQVQDGHNATFIAASRAGWPTSLHCLKTAIEGLINAEAANTDEFGGCSDIVVSTKIYHALNTLCGQWEALK